MSRGDREREVARLLARRAAALERVRGLPNVRSVGVGLQERAGVPTGALAFRVYVDVKVPRDQLAPGELVPDAIEGIPTDVIQIPQAQPACWNKGTRPVVGGLQLASSPFDAMHSQPGTLGCLVTTTDGKAAVLSAEHVLQFKTNTDKRAWQPHYDSCLGFKCNKIGATVDGFEDHFAHQGTEFWIDAAFAVLDEGIGSRPRLRRIVDNAVGGFTDVPLPPGVEGIVRVNPGGKVVSIRDENGTLVDTMRIAAATAAAVPGTIVWKIGDRSQLTAGIVHDPLGTVQVRGELNNNVILIRALAGYTDETGTALFADNGDSGSVILDLSNRVVGVITGKFRPASTLEWFAYASNIAPVLARLPVSITPSPEPPTPTAATQVVPEDDADVDDVDLGERLHALERRLRATRAGPILLALIERHAGEAYELVTCRRAVTVVWHRHRGPAFAARLARALREPGGRLPVEVDGVALNSLLAAMAAALERHGSPALRASLDRHARWLLQLLDGCTDVTALLARLETRSPVASP
jgi:hypothetical protein